MVVGVLPPGADIECVVSEIRALGDHAVVVEGPSGPGIVGLVRGEGLHDTFIGIDEIVGEAGSGLVGVVAASHVELGGDIRNSEAPGDEANGFAVLCFGEIGCHILAGSSDRADTATGGLEGRGRDGRTVGKPSVGLVIGNHVDGLEADPSCLGTFNSGDCEFLLDTHKRRRIDGEIGKPS